MQSSPLRPFRSRRTACSLMHGLWPACITPYSTRRRLAAQGEERLKIILPSTNPDRGGTDVSNDGSVAAMCANVVSKSTRTHSGREEGGRIGKGGEARRTPSQHTQRMPRNKASRSESQALEGRFFPIIRLPIARIESRLRRQGSLALERSLHQRRLRRRRRSVGPRRHGRRR